MPLTGAVIKISNEDVAVDEMLMFLRICVTKQSEEELKKYLQYELARYPLAIFDKSVLRKTAKSALIYVFEPDTKLLI